ncbi:MAG TPA: dTDP-glucose 4,6-dehydratase [Pricia sp.]|nr:dTDP-glucose 4,6-dehydratase [Pricia sp.]
MKILISGTAGFIFSNFVIYALQHTDWDIVSIDKLTYAGSLLNVPQVKRHKLYIGDVCDYHFVRKVFEIEKPDIVIHAAAESHVDNSIESSNAFVTTNVTGTHSMLEAALHVHTPQKFINISTDEVYGSVEEGHSLETDMLEPRSPYSSTKASADLLGQSYFVTHGLPVITTRCSNNFGPRQHVEKFLPKVITNILTEQKIPLYGDGKNMREWIYVKDNFGALVKIIENGEPGEVYNISSGFEKQNIEVLKTIFDIMGGEELLEYVADRKGHDRRYSVDCSKLRVLGWEPQYPFENALVHTIGWYKANTWFWRK